MSGEVSYLSRFFVKFVEIIGAGLASAICAYVLAHFGGLRPSAFAPVSAPPASIVWSGPTADVAPAAPPVPKAVKDARTLRPQKHTKTDTSTTEKKPPGQKSAEALARAALANV